MGVGAGMYRGFFENFENLVTFGPRGPQKSAKMRFLADFRGPRGHISYSFGLISFFWGGETEHELL